MRLSYKIKTHHLLNGEPICGVFRIRANVLDGGANPTCVNCQVVLTSEGQRFWEKKARESGAREIMQDDTESTR